MDSTKVNGVELEFEVTGSGEPVLLSSPAVPRGSPARIRPCPT